MAQSGHSDYRVTFMQNQYQNFIFRLEAFHSGKRQSCGISFACEELCLATLNCVF